MLGILIASLFLIEAVESLNESLYGWTVAVELCCGICSGCDLISICNYYFNLTVKTMFLNLHPSAWARILVCQNFSVMLKQKFLETVRNSFKSLPISEPTTWFIKPSIGFVFFRLYLKKDAWIKSTIHYNRMTSVRVTSLIFMLVIGQRYTYSFKCDNKSS